jgi:protein-tyrosine phosphatase
MPITEIIKGLLYLGSLEDAISKKDMEKLNIKIIYNVAKECRSEYFHLGIKVNNYPIIDSSKFKINPYIDRIIDDINRNISNRDPVFIHCRMGRSRSVAIILAYLIKYNNKTLSESLQYVKNQRKINPNAGFMSELVDFEYKLTKLKTIDPVEYREYLKSNYIKKR